MLQNKIKEIRKDLSQLVASKDKDISNFRHWERLKRKYSIILKRLNVAIEEMKQRITAIAANVRRYHGRVDSYRQNSLFENKKKDVKMPRLWLGNRNGFGQTYGVSLQILRRMQSGFKTCEVKLMLKKWRR